MLLGFDHMILGTTDLQGAIAELAGHGINAVTRPDVRKPDELVANAFVGFADGSYLQLFSLTRPATVEEHRWAPRVASGGGWIDYSFWTRDSGAAAARLAAAGIPFQGPRGGRGELTDGQAWRIEVVQPQAAAGLGLPFLVGDLSERSLRVPPSQAGDEQLGIVGATLAVEDIARASEALQAGFGPDLVLKESDGSSALFEFAGRWVAVHALPEVGGSAGLLEVAVGTRFQTRPDSGKVVQVASAGMADLRLDLGRA